MRTTITIDPDTEALLKEETARSGQSFKVVLNQSIRRALGHRARPAVALQPLFTAAFPPALLETSMNRLADALDDEETLRELQA
jgi:hypothetical protein